MQVMFYNFDVQFCSVPLKFEKPRWKNDSISSPFFNRPINVWQHEIVKPAEWFYQLQNEKLEEMLVRMKQEMQHVTK